ncbi:hypothetical protein K1719_026683 [Acacia pycnantha]|nr:hypothetical protein K1719_026683 [Acacia pycnantha]
MERTLVIKLLGRTITYLALVAKTQALWQTRGFFQLVDMAGGFYLATFDLEEDYIKALMGGLWMIFGAYLVVQPWSLNFDPSSTSVSNVVVWVRILGLSFRYYHRSILQAIDLLLGKVVKVDHMTENKGRGKFARIVVVMDISQPLIPWIKVDGKLYCVEYEGLPHICFECGKYGHTAEKCKKPTEVGTVPKTQRSDIVIQEAAGSPLAVAGGGPEQGPRAKTKAPKTTQEYRVKKHVDIPPRPSPTNNKVGSGSTLLGPVAAPAIGPNQEDASGLHEMNITGNSLSDLPQNSMVCMALDFTTVEATTSLDCNKHTMIELKRARQALNEINPPPSGNTNDLCCQATTLCEMERGKEKKDLTVLST